MTEKAANHIPPGWPSVVPRLSVDEPEQLVTFLKEVFGASGRYNENHPSEVWIGESLVMVGDIVERMPTESFIYVYVEDADAAYSRALALGARSLEEPSEMEYGDRRAMIQDRWGNRWQIATHRGFDGA